MKRTSHEYEGSAKRSRPDGAEPSKVLHVRALPDFTTENELVGVVSQYGEVVKCLLLTDKHQGFIQMESVDAASDVLQRFAHAPPSIREKDIFFQFSNRQEISTPGDSAHHNEGQGTTPIILITVVNVNLPVSLDNIYQICKPYGDIMKIITFTKRLDYQALVEFGSVESAFNAKLNLEGKDLFQGCCHIRVGFSKRKTLVVKQNDHKSRDFTLKQIQPPKVHGNLQQATNGGESGGGPLIGGGTSLMGGDVGGMGMGMMMNMGGGSTVILVNKLVQDKITPDILFTLFGVYGDVIRVKILFNKRDTALIQYSNPQQACMAVRHLNNCVLHGQSIVVQISRMAEIKLPRNDNDQELTKDYAGSRLHRFRKKSFINPKNVNPPSQVLHVANLYDNATEQELRTLFGSEQQCVPIVEFFKSTRKMCYICMASVPHAVNALINLHNCDELGGYPLRVSFSHKDPGSIRSSEGTT